MPKGKPNRGSKVANSSLGKSLANDREKFRQRYREAKADSKPEFAASKVFKKQTKKNLDSVTQESSLEEFMAKAELAQIDFAAERKDFRILSDRETIAIAPTKEEIKSVALLQKKYEHRLKIPRRPAKDLWNTAEELICLENKNFLEWRSNLASMENIDGLVLTPYERNIEIWRQLWRVIERSDIIVQIVDARNPLLFRSSDLEKYVKECGIGKQNLLLINKVDLLSEDQLKVWRKWSALEEEKRKTEDEDVVAEAQSGSAEDESNSDSDNNLENYDERTHVENDPEVDSGSAFNDRIPVLRDPKALVEHFKSLAYASSCGVASRSVVVGMIGYPNVGKSSTINRIIGAKKVSVSATPGKTRHFQTIIYDSELTLCDCPGLVMPCFALSRSEMILNGILSVDHMTDAYGPISLLTSRVPCRYFELIYSVLLPDQKNNSVKYTSANQLLTTVAFSRGFMTASGIPDCSRAARYIIKDLISGKFKWVAAPPDFDQELFDEINFRSTDGKTDSTNESALVYQLRRRFLLEDDEALDNRLDSEFFSTVSSGFCVNSCRGPLQRGKLNEGSDLGKIKLKKQKREKLRRVFGHLDA